MDAFADTDTAAYAAGLQRVAWDGAGFCAELPDRVEQFMRARGGACIVPGSGFEAAPELLAALARLAGAVAGSPAETFAACRGGPAAAGLLQRLGIPFAQVYLTPPPAGDWLLKHVGGLGGGHVRHWTAADAAPPAGAYWQRHVRGPTYSVNYLADTRRAVLLGCNRIFARGGGDFRPRLAVAVPPPAPLAGILQEVLDTLVAGSGQRGLCGLDLVLAGADGYVIDVNPRPTATFELHERRGGLFALHLAACRGQLPARLPPLLYPDATHAQAVYYARHALCLPPTWRWPAWTADRPAPGSHVAAGAPLCSIHARAAHARAACRLLHRRRRHLHHLLTPTGASRSPRREPGSSSGTL